MNLEWPLEKLAGHKDVSPWRHAGTNFCLDFIGDPQNADLVVFSDGNHHMALSETIREFQNACPKVHNVFYTTTPPGPILDLLKNNSIQMGNLVLTVIPHVFISPPHVLDSLVEQNEMAQHYPLMENQGNVLLVKKGNPHQINGVVDLFEKPVKVFLSNPETETVSYKGYARTILNLAQKAGIIENGEGTGLPEKRIVYGKSIHHREAPQSVAGGTADVAMIYYHLALRYTRIFPEVFELIPLGGTATSPKPEQGNIISKTHVGLIGNGGKWGETFLGFLLSKKVAKIYKGHGLIPLTG